MATKRDKAIAELADCILLTRETLKLRPHDELVRKNYDWQFALLDLIIEHPEEDPQAIAQRLSGTEEIIRLAGERGIVPTHG